jgi:hypothetical protein
MKSTSNVFSLESPGDEMKDRGVKRVRVSKASEGALSVTVSGRRQGNDDPNTKTLETHSSDRKQLKTWSNKRDLTVLDEIQEMPRVIMN